MSTRSRWTRVEGHHRSRDLRGALKVRVADPLWTLGRQWQFGEFKGDDAASPVKVRVKHNSLNVDQLSLYDDKGAVSKTHALNENDLLEPIVERNSISKNSAVDARVSAEAAVQFICRLPVSVRGGALGVLQNMYPLVNTADTPRPALMTLLMKKSFDARRLRRIQNDALRGLATQIGITFSEADTIFKGWAAYYDARFSEPQNNIDTWQKDRLEYRFGVSARVQGSTAKVALKAQEYNGGGLDWYQFDLDTDNSKRLEADIAGAQENWLIPAPVRYAGMPADRFWNFEDGRVFFGGLDAEKTDLSRLLLSEFATVYSNDWYMLPLGVKTGHVTRIHTIEVWDSFGDRHEVEPTAVKDEERGVRGWKFLELSGDESAKHGHSPWLYSPRSILGGHEDRPVEKVVFTRDEMANMAWGIEETIEDTSGHRISRRGQWMKHRDAIAAYAKAQNDISNENADDKNAWVYRLLSSAPPYWTPFIPEIVDGYVTNRLIRGRMGEWDLLGELKEKLAGGQGRILQSGAAMVLQEEEIPRGAIEVTRSYQAARSTNGDLVVWNGYKKRPGKSEPASGRETDKIEGVK